MKILLVSSALVILAHDVSSRDRSVNQRPQAFSRDVIDDVEHPEAPAGGNQNLQGSQALLW